MNKIFLVTLALCFFTSFATQAQDINLTAEEKVEWHDNEQKLIAVGNAVVTRADMQIKAQHMEGVYNKAPKADKKAKIKEIHAKEKVEMKTNKVTAYGDTLDYSLEKDTAVLKGSPAKIMTKENSLTAEESIIYYPGQNKAIATGNVTVKEKDNTINSQQMIAYFKENQGSKLEIEKIEMNSSIFINSPKGKVFADSGIYFPDSGLVKLYNNVRIEKDGNTLHGDYAQTNVKTGVSKIISNKQGKSRVHGVFKEQKKDKTDAK